MHDDERDAVATVAALHAARRTGVLDALLDTADTPTAVAAETGVDERTAGVLIDVLADRGFFERVDDAYEPTNRALGLLTKTDLRSIGSTPHDVDRFACYAELPEMLATSGTDADGNASADAAENANVDADGNDDADATRFAANRPANFDRNRLGALQATSDAVVNAAVSAAIRAVPAPTSVLDIGGAPGRYATEFAARGHDVTLRDVPALVDAARPLLDPRAVTLDPGDLTTGLPTAELAFASDLTPRLDDTDLDSALAATRDALARTDEDGRDGDTTADDATAADAREDASALVAIEHVQDRSPRTPTRRLEALATGRPGDHRTEPALRNALENAGFDHVELHAVPGLDRHAIVATPRST